MLHYMSYATPSELPTFNQLLKCRNARVSGIRSVWYQNEKNFIAGTSPVRNKGTQSGIGMLRYRIKLLKFSQFVGLILPIVAIKATQLLTS
jgi:hypothetical protein